MIEDVLLRLRPSIAQMKPYSSARLYANALELQEQVLLNANENSALPYSEDRCTEGYNRYPEPQPAELISRLALLYGVDTPRIIAARGSDELIDLLIRAFCAADNPDSELADKILICPPSFGMYEVYANIQGVATIKLPLLAGQAYQLDLKAILELSQAENPPKLIFIPNPSAPLGHLLDRSKILALCQKLEKTLIVVDEAYMDFLEYREHKSHSLIGELAKFPNLLILRTMSKAYAMAGLRLGLAIAHPAIVSVLRNIIAPYPIPNPVIDIALQALSPKGIARVHSAIPELVKRRQELETVLQELAYVKYVFPSVTNFIFIQVERGAELLSYLKKQKIIIRSFLDSSPAGLRITVGSKTENELLIQHLKLFSRKLSEAN